MPRALSTREQTSIARQRQRSAELDQLRLQRRLTEFEQAEADRLTQALYMREWRREQAERWSKGRSIGR